MNISDDFKEALILDKIKTIKDNAATYLDLSDNIDLNSNDSVMMVLISKIINQVEILKKLTIKEEK